MKCIPISLLFIIVLTSKYSVVYGRLKLTNVIFRHGQRTADTETSYPNDPYINETYAPYGGGQLINVGKMREYKIGKALRKRYNKFLTATYSPDVLEAVSTDISRTKMSLLLVLAGLYPPKNTKLDWHNALNWQPIPYSSVPYDKDILMTLSNYFCPNYIKLYNEYMKSPIGLTIRNAHEDLFEYMSVHTGATINNTFDVYMLYLHLLPQHEFGLKLPPWTRTVFPKRMRDVSIEQYSLNAATTELKQLSGGFLLRKMIEDMEHKIAGDLQPRDRKIFLYSGHEYNIANVLNALEVYFPHIPPYGAYILVELHEIGGEHGVKIFYQEYSSYDPQLLKIPGCSAFCPMHRFVKILQKNIPINQNACDEILPGDEVNKNQLS